MRAILAAVLAVGTAAVSAVRARADEPPAVSAPPAPTAAIDLAKQALGTVYDLVLAGRDPRPAAQEWLAKIDAAEKRADDGSARAHLVAAAVQICEYARLWDPHYTHLLRLLYLAPNGGMLEDRILVAGQLVAIEAEYPRLLVARSSGRLSRCESMLDALDYVASRYAGETAGVLALNLAADLLFAIGDDTAARAVLDRIVRDYADHETAVLAESRLWSLKHLAVGSIAPSPTWSTVDGRSIALSALRGKHVVVYQWTTHCGPCHAKAEALRQLQEKCAERVVFVGLSYDKDVSTTKDTLKLWSGPSGPQVHMGSQPDSTRWPSTSFPRLIILDASGMVLSADGPIDLIVENLEGRGVKPRSGK